MSSSLNNERGGGCDLPVAAVLPELRRALASSCAAVLVAAPGAGKTTFVPPVLLEEPWLAGKTILMLEPRRLAARAAASRMASLRGERVGETVGYRVRLESRVGPRTRIEVVTEGVLLRRLQADPGLEGVGLIVFDEFHERHLESDLGLALCLDLRRVLRPDLRLLVMSATLEAEPVAALLGGAPVIRAEGRAFPVAVRYLPDPRPLPFERKVADAVKRAAPEAGGGLLVFLPGAAEIRRVSGLLQGMAEEDGCLVLPLLGTLPRPEQERAIAAAPPGKRKIVLATSVAETSLTIEGIGCVVDGGRMRVPRFDPARGLTRLVTVPVSQAAAEQRRGRAGRTGPGLCIRLWGEAEQRLLPERNRPEILECDLAAAALELALWGVSDPAALSWLDPPPPASWRQAVELLQLLKALDAEGRVTGHGREMAELALHPRLAHMVLAAHARGQGKTACRIAAILSERDFLHFPPGEADADLALRLEVLADAGRGLASAGESRLRIDREALRRCRAFAAVLERRLGIDARKEPEGDPGRLLTWAYPERIGRRRPGPAPRYLLASGQGAFFGGAEPLSAAETIVAAVLDGNPREARIFLAAACTEETLLEDFADRLEVRRQVRIERETETVRAETLLCLSGLVLRRDVDPQPDPEAVADALLAALREKGAEGLPWTESARRLQGRMRFARRFAERPEEWPDVADETLIAGLERWLKPFVSGIRRPADIAPRRLEAALRALLSPAQLRWLASGAPETIRLPNGREFRLDYRGETPVLAARVQDLFGCREIPRLAGGRAPVTVCLLSPAGRPVQVTADLAGFWRGSYREVRKALRGRYPKHPWPEDPLRAEPPAGGGRRRGGPR
ncbi:MAG: ATP-dependent helicase HrpB [Desulfobacterales bacterium]